MNFEIPKKELEKIEQAIASDESVVGIDAKKTHIIIIHMLNEIQQRLNLIEEKLGRLEN
jgi:hypothetical protein